MRESFQYDAITSQMAAARGVIANAFDMFDTFALRRQHPPFLSYVILANNALFGSGDLAACAFSIVSGALTCVVVAFGVLVALGARREGASGGETQHGAFAQHAVRRGAFAGRDARGAFLAALFAGWLLAFLPVHLFVSRSANWDALYALFSTSVLVLLARYVSAAPPPSDAPGSPPHAARAPLFAAAALAGFALLTSELGVFLAPSFLVALAIDARRLPRRELVARYALAATIVLTLVAALWPAGIFKLHLARTILQRAGDSVLADRNHPWHTIYRDLFTQSPAFAIAAAIGFAAFAPAIVRALVALARKRPLAPSTRFALALAPLWIHAAVAILMSTRQSWVHIHLKNDMFPPLAILGACAFAAFADSGTRGHANTAAPARTPNRAQRAAPALIVAAGIIVIAVSVLSATRTTDTMIVGPEEHPGYRGVAAFVAQHPDARVYYYYAPLLRHFLAQHSAIEPRAPRPTTAPQIESDATRAWTPEQIASVKSRAYDFVVTDFSFFDAHHPDIDALAAAFAPEYALAHTVAHRRTGAAIAWIFAPVSRQ
ncbi:MAG: hypothetical protein ACKVU1_10820 [bacterium]